MFTKIYGRVTKITPQQIFIGATLTGAVGVGGTAYFSIGEPSVIEVQINDGQGPPELDLDETTKIIEEETKMQSDVIDEEIESYFKE